MSIIIAVIASIIAILSIIFSFSVTRQLNLIGSACKTAIANLNDNQSSLSDSYDDDYDEVAKRSLDKAIDNFKFSEMDEIASMIQNDVNNYIMRASLICEELRDTYGTGSMINFINQVMIETVIVYFIHRDQYGYWFDFLAIPIVDDDCEVNNETVLRREDFAYLYLYIQKLMKSSSKGDKCVFMMYLNNDN